MKLGLLIILLCFGVQSLQAQVIFRGVVKDSKGELLPGATIVVAGSQQGVVSAYDGSFELGFAQPGRYQIEVRFVGFESIYLEVEAGGQTAPAEIVLSPVRSLISEVVVTGTRTSRGLFEVPVRLEVVNRSRVEATPALSADDFLKSLPGLNVSRGAAFLSSATVTMRGMSNEQGRVLVMQDGVPLNKTDGGSVNWNALDALGIEKVEVLKGPGSSIHGGNAMGGVINFISSVPTRRLESQLRQSYGTFGTSRTNLDISGRSGKLFWRTGAFYRNSDGYVTTPVDEINQYTIASFLDEYRASGRIGYLFSDQHLISGGVSYYNGQRGTGSRFEGFDLASPEGAYNNFANFNGNVNYSGNFSDLVSLNIIAYGQRENYQIIRESLRGTQLTRFDVESIRSDFGLFSSINIKTFKNHSLLGGIDFRHGGVDGADRYVTSTDQVLNLGKMNQLGIFLQDEFNPGGGPWRILAGLRFDFSGFYDGAFRVINPTSATSFLQNFAGELGDASWSAFSPRLSVQYYNPQFFRVYTGYSRGFRAPVLDDLCRTGRISGGMKLANPFLKPEYLDNFELGADFFPFSGLVFTTSGFYSIGTDYHAFISTGDSLRLGGRMQPIRRKDNIGKVNIMGTEIAANYQLSRNITMNAAWSYTHTEIVEFRLLNPNIDLNLAGKELVFQPINLLNVGLIWQTKWFNLLATYNYKDAQWLNDANTEKIESFSTVDLQVNGRIFRGIMAAIMVHNLLDSDYIDSRNVIAPGRMITAELRFNF